MKISVEDRVRDLRDRFCVEAAVQDPFVRLSAQGVYKRSHQKLSVIKYRSKISEQDLCSLHQVSVQDLYKRSLGKISVQDL